MRRSVPFSVTIMTLMALIVVPLSVTLLWLGWRAVDRMEKEDVDQRMAELDTAVTGFLSNGMRLTTSVGQALGEQPAFAPQADADEQRLGQLVSLLHRHPAVDAAYVGYPDGRMVYAGRTEAYSPAQRAEFSIPPGDPIVRRVIDGAARRELWRFVGADGALSEPRERATDFDPRQRPWYIGALQSGAPALTAPYRFAWSGEPGISLGVPMAHGGVIGFDASLGTLSRLIVQYKVTPNAIIVIAAGGSDVFIETRPCDPTDATCLSGDAEVRALVRQTVAAAAGQRVRRELVIAGRGASPSRRRCRSTS
jgi:adenylate cyclase